LKRRTNKKTPEDQIKLLEQMVFNYETLKKEIKKPHIQNTKIKFKQHLIN